MSQFNAIKRFHSSNIFFTWVGISIAPCLLTFQLLSDSWTPLLSYIGIGCFVLVLPELRAWYKCFTEQNTGEKDD